MVSIEERRIDWEEIQYLNEPKPEVYGLDVEYEVGNDTKAVSTLTSPSPSPSPWPSLSLCLSSPSSSLTTFLSAPASTFSSTTATSGLPSLNCLKVEVIPFLNSLAISS